MAIALHMKEFSYGIHNVMELNVKYAVHFKSLTNNYLLQEMARLTLYTA